MSGYGTPSGYNPQSIGTTAEGPSIEIEHPISLKVMRLKRPEFQSKNLPLPDFKKFILREQSSSSSSLNELKINDFSELLTLPNGFGKIYVGETFTSYLSLHNHSYEKVSNVALKAEIFSRDGKNKNILLDLSAKPIETFPTGVNKGFVINHHLNESGLHLLYCTVEYIVEVDHRKEKRSFQKVYKFPVAHPLPIREIRVSPYRLNSIFITIDLNNATDQTLFINRIRFNPSFQFDVLDHNDYSLKSEDDFEPGSVLSQLKDFAQKQADSNGFLMQKGEKRRFIFELVYGQSNTTKPNRSYSIRQSKNEKNPASMVEALGKIEFQWRGLLGEMGGIVTQTLYHKNVNPINTLISSRTSASVLSAQTLIELKQKNKSFLLNEVSFSKKPVPKDDTSKPASPSEYYPIFFKKSEPIMRCLRDLDSIFNHMLQVRVEVLDESIEVYKPFTVEIHLTNIHSLIKLKNVEIQLPLDQLYPCVPCSKNKILLATECIEPNTTESIFCSFMSLESGLVTIGGMAPIYVKAYFHLTDSYKYQVMNSFDILPSNENKYASVKPVMNNKYNSTLQAENYGSSFKKESADNQSVNKDFIPPLLAKVSIPNTYVFVNQCEKKTNVAFTSPKSLASPHKKKKKTQKKA